MGSVLFDLDGTLIDTAPDLALALNATLAHYGRKALPLAQIRPQASHGSIALIQLGFGPDTPDFEHKKKFLLDYYLNHIAEQSRLFDGMEEVLMQLQKQGLPWGIVTNKPSWLTQPLLSHFQWHYPPSCVISGDTCSHRKPHPEPLLLACRQIGCLPWQSYYIGDAQRDMQAGRWAGMRTVLAHYGYLEDEDHQDWVVDHRIDHPLDLIPVIQNR